MYTRWLQAGAFSGTMRSHERGMSAGGCADNGGVTPTSWGPNSCTCSIVEPWNVGPKFFEANRRALQARERRIPYIYTCALHVHYRPVRGVSHISTRLTTYCLLLTTDYLLLTTDYLLLTT